MSTSYYDETKLLQVSRFYVSCLFVIMFELFWWPKQNSKPHLTLRNALSSSMCSRKISCCSSRKTFSTGTRGLSLCSFAKSWSQVWRKCSKVLETQVTFSSTAIYQLSAIPIRYPGHFSHGSLKVNSNQRVVLKKHQTHIINDGRLPASRRLPGTSTSKIQISSQSCCWLCMLWLGEQTCLETVQKSDASCAWGQLKNAWPCKPCCITTEQISQSILVMATPKKNTIIYNRALGFRLQASRQRLSYSATAIYFANVTVIVNLVLSLKLLRLTSSVMSET